ncbi:MAG: methylmalonyl-CoA epimerase [Phascolarctobacterium sp.]|nr:methylmalonyl-CoA epimerase [Phascolarctobacterium sp.]MCD8175524.1 methylmalonyl-CoA epimerase [Phascolarctobacterium sp.]
MAFKTICVDHIGIACADLDAAAKLYTEVLGLSVTDREKVLDQGVETVFVPCGETLIELLVDITQNNDGPIGKYIAKNGPGIQHMALRVDDLKAAIAACEAAGVRMIDKVARDGAGKMKIAFVHPKSAGLLLELCQPAATFVD